ncbi:MAG: protein translocase subunit SecF [bacterium]
MNLFRNINFDFVKYRYTAITISLVIITAGIISMIIKGGLNLGVDFRGGVLMEIAFENNPDVAEVRSVLKTINLEESTIQQVLNRNSIIIRINKEKVAENAEGTVYEKVNKQITEAFENKFGKNKIRFERVEYVGPLVGKDLKSKAVLATIFSWLGIIIYLSFRFEFKYGLAAVLALIHDVLITLSFFSFLNKEFNLTVLAAILTLIGFSVNDTIVIFDRIREDIRLYPKDNYPSLVNRSINETLSRTILTTLTAIFSVVVLFLFGGPVIHDFAFALVIGFISGTYSTVYIAAPILIDWEKIFPRKK